MDLNTLLDINPKINSAYWIYSLKIKDRDKFITYMRLKGICVSQIHGRNDIHSCVSEFKTNLPILNEIEKNIVCIPVGWWLTQEQVDYIIKCIKEWDVKRKFFLYRFI